MLTPDVCEILSTCQHYHSDYCVVKYAPDKKLPRHDMCLRRADAGC